MSLFPTYKFPTTRYQGSKYKLSSWIRKSLERLEFDTCLDAFSGTSSIAYVMKDMGREVYTNDLLKSNCIIARAMIENNTARVSAAELNFVLNKEPNYKYKTFISDTFRDIYFLDEENQWLDIVIQNILRVPNEGKRSMLLWALFQSAISKRPYNLFHRKNLHIRTAEVKRSFGNKSTWDKQFEEHFRSFVQEINAAIFDNGHKNRSFCGDVFDLDLKPDLVYVDTPYIPSKGTLTHYRDFYHFLDGLADYYNWEWQIDYGSKHKKLISKYNIWQDKHNIKTGFAELIDKFREAKIVISYREDGIPSIAEIAALLKRHGKSVSIESLDYRYVLSKKSNLKEVLIVSG